MSSILRDSPLPPSQIRTGLPKPIDDLILSCLDKDSARRPSARTVSDTLRRLSQDWRTRESPRFARAGVLVPVVLVLAAVMAFFAWSAASRSRRAVFVAESLPPIEALARDGKDLEAFDLAREVERNGAASVAEELWGLRPHGCPLNRSLPARP